MPGWWAWRALPDGALSGYPRGCHSRLCGNALLKPLDSGLRRNDEGAVVEHPLSSEAGAGGMTIGLSLFPIVIPAKAGIQEGMPGW